VLGTDAAIDLGTSKIQIYVNGRGIVVDEPSVVAINSDTEELVAVGKEAYRMVGRTSDRISVFYPLSNGVISDFATVEQMLGRFLKQVSSSMVFMPRVVACIPGEVTEVEKRAVVNAISSHGVRKICLIEEPVAAAIGAGIDISTPHGSLVVDIGAGTTDMAVISLSGVATMRSVKVAGNSFDEAVIKYVKKKYNLIIGKRMAEEAKLAIGCVYPQEEQQTFRIKGRNALTGLPQWVDFTSDEMLEALIDLAMQIAREIQEMLEDTPPELVGDIYTDGITLTGGSALLYGFETLISKKTRLPVRVAEDPRSCVVLGAGKALKYIDELDENHEFGAMNPLSAEY
jgi:rod shape-determining protein MreB